MAAVTALIFVGNSHPNDGGLRPSILIQLEEGDRPSFNFRKLGAGSPVPAFKMIPTVKYMLDDLILMIAYAWENVPAVVTMLDQFIEKTSSIGVKIEMTKDLTEDQRKKLYDLLKPNQDLPKIGICLFEGSSLKHCIKNLNQYSMECEVSESIFVRSWSGWDRKWRSIGNL
jgi:hypothetical protein